MIIGRSSNMKNIVWGMIGCGDVTEVKNGPGMYLSERSVLKGITNRTIAKAHDWVKRHGHGIVYNSVEELLADPEIDIVYIATTPDTHTKYALMVAQAGKHCLVDKPVAPTYADGVQIKEAFEKAGKRCYVAFYRRELNRFQELKSILDSGRVGKVMGVNVMRTAHKLPADSGWRVDPAICGGDVFTETDIHALDMLVRLFGHVKSFTYTKVPDTYGVTIQYESGVVGSGMWNYNAQLLKDEVNIVGTKGHIRFEFFNNDGPFCITDEDGVEELTIKDSIHVGMNMQQQIVDELLGEGGCFSATIEEALESLKITDGVYYNR